MKRAVIYARFSTENQKDASIDDQFRLCQRVVEQHGLELVGRFEDRAISGGTDQRPGYQAMLQLARARGFDILVTEDVSRLSRNIADAGNLSVMLQDARIDLITCVGDDTRTQGWGLVIHMKQAIAAHLRTEISHKTRRGLEGRALAGAPTGGRTYGYSRPDTVDEAQAAYVRAIFKDAAAGRAATGIAASLNEQRVPSPRGGRWNEATVKHMLKNRRYIGEVSYGVHQVRRSAQDSKKRILERRPEPISVRQVPELAIVPRELFDKVQEVRTASQKAKPWLCEPFSTANQPHN